MVNPLDLRGPEFLDFYVGLGAAVTVLAWLVRRMNERGEPPRPLSDYLEIAFLRGGAVEAIRVAALTLIDRGALSIEGEDTVVAANDATRRVTKTTERAIVTRVGRATTMLALLGDKAIAAAVTAECEPELVRRGLLPDDVQKASRKRLWVASAGLLGLVAAAKIAVALARGHSNVGFLAGLAVVFAALTAYVTQPRLTPAGQALVGDLRTLFAGLKDRASSLRPQSGGTDLALLVAVFGVGAALPVYPETERLFPRVSPSDGGGGSDSSCGSSSGGSCGGGGGGSGCGGCGS